MRRKIKNGGELMTKVVYGKTYDRFYLEISGHAYPEYGDTETQSKQDGSESTAVCAAISILALSAGQMLGEMDANGEFSSCSITLDDGYALFDITPSDAEVSGKTEVIFEVLMGGINYLEENYPYLVTVE